MGKSKKIFFNIIIVLLLAISLTSGTIAFLQWREGYINKESFRALTDFLEEPVIPPVSEPVSPPASEPSTIPIPPQKEETPANPAYEKYLPLYEKNRDFVGWLYCEGTRINYPVMQTPDRPDYYLRRGFDKAYSYYGVPYLKESCDLETSNNLVLYGHNMKNGTMLSDLTKYKSEDFYKSHPYIQFDTLQGFGTYRVLAAFDMDIDYDPFQYHTNNHLTEAEFHEFLIKCSKRRFYDTGVEAHYGDRLLTLSTCEYTHSNGRFVVVAVKVEP